MKAIFEVQRELNSITLWEAGVGHRIVFPTEELCEKNEEILLTDERKFQQAKTESGVACIDKWGELVSPFEYIQRTLKSYKCGIGKYLGIIVYENYLTRPSEEYW